MSARADPLLDSYYWKKIVAALIVNALTMPIIIAFLFWSGLAEAPFEKILATFQSNYSPFFWPWSRFFRFFRTQVVIPAVIEELFTRGPIRILVLVFSPFLIPKRKMWRFLLPAVGIAGIILNYQWALTHTTHKLAWILVFVAGLPWLWLVIETRRLWPAMFCHAAANLSIYFLIKIYQSLY